MDVKAKPRPVRAPSARHPSGRTGPRLAILVPYRNRESYLRIFLREVPRYLEEVNRIFNYRIYVAEQTSDDVFNLALSRDVAARAALADGGFDYFVFHDVDTIPVAHIDYGPRPYNVAWFLTAGSCKVRAADLVAANGYNPHFRGWGDEDTDFYHRLGQVGAPVKEWHRIPESQRAVAMNLEWPALSDAEAHAWSKSYFGHQGQGPRFVSYRGRVLNGARLQQYDKSTDFLSEGQRQRNHDLWSWVATLGREEKAAYMRDNGMNQVRLAGAARSFRDGVHWIAYQTRDVLDRDRLPRRGPRPPWFADGADVTERGAGAGAETAGRGQQSSAVGDSIAASVMSADVAYGCLGLGGDLGYEGLRVADPWWPHPGVISAHGPSEVRLAVPAGAVVQLVGAINDDAMGQKVVARFTVDDRAGRRLADLGLAAPGRATAAAAVVAPPDGQLVLRCHATTRHWCHALWILGNGVVGHHHPDAALASLTEELRGLGAGAGRAREVEVAHMPGASGLRGDNAALEGAVTLVLRAIRAHHERVRVQAERGAAGDKRAAFILLHPSQADLLEAGLAHASEMGALAGLEALLVIEDEPDRERRTSVIRETCARYGVMHRYAESRIGYGTAGQTRALIHHLRALAEAVPQAAWILRVDGDLLLVGDAFAHHARRGVALDADLCANIRPDGRFDPNGRAIICCSAFSSATCRALGALLDGPDWSLVEAHLAALDDLDLTGLVRLLGREVAPPEGRAGFAITAEAAEPGPGSAASAPGSLVPAPTPATATPRIDGGAGRSLVRILSSRVGQAVLTADGTLGYDGGCSPRPRCRVGLDDHVLLSAHAPSRLEIETDEPLEIFGFLNASARFQPRNPVELWADWNFLGDLSIPGSISAVRRLEPGRHVLSAICGNSDARHTLWAARRAPVGEGGAPRLAVITIAAYPEERVPSELGLLARSALKHGIDLAVCFVGESYRSHAEMKVRRLRPVIAGLRALRILYIDGRDCLFVADAARIERQFDSLSTPLVVSAEAQCWPIVDPAWADRFPRQPGGCNWINAGQWMGERDAVLRALEVLEDLDERAARDPAADELADLRLCRRCRHDDQLLWQVAAVNDLFELTVDHHGRLFRNVHTLDASLIDNRDFDLRDGVVCKPSGQRPCVLHFSGGTAAYCMQQWGGLLGAY